jgi:hypothetical protein
MSEGEGHMKKGYKVIDMDTHVGPSLDVLCEYVDPGFRPRLRELEQYRQKGGQKGEARCQRVQDRTTSEVCGNSAQRCGSAGSASRT